MAFYLFNVVPRDAADVPLTRTIAVDSLGAGMWGVDLEERHAMALEVGDVVLVYLGAPDRVFIARAELASRVHRWTDAEAGRYPGALPGGVLLTNVEEWDPPVPIIAVLAEIGPSDTTKADFPHPVVAIIGSEYEAALAVAARR